MIDIEDLWRRFCENNKSDTSGYFCPERDFEELVNPISKKAFENSTKQDGFKVAPRQESVIVLEYYRNKRNLFSRLLFKIRLWFKIFKKK